MLEPTVQARIPNPTTPSGTDAPRPEPGVDRWVQGPWVQGPEAYSALANPRRTRT